MKIGILGGTFDPIHNGHLYIGYEAKLKLNLDKVIFVPAGIQPFKMDKKVTESSIRYNMIKEALRDYEGLEVSEYEINKNGISYTYETLQHFKNVFNNENSEIYFITGADCLLSIDTWMQSEKIFELSKIVVFMRGGINKDELKKKKEFIEDKYNTEIIFLDLNELEISSSDIRERIHDDKKVDFFIPKCVKEFIDKNNLYR